MTSTLAQRQLAGGGSLQDSNLQPTDYSTLSSSIKRQLNLSGYVQVTVYLCKELEKETVRLKRLVAELSLEKQVLRDVAQGNL